MSKSTPVEIPATISISRTESNAQGQYMSISVKVGESRIANLRMGLGDFTMAITGRYATPAILILSAAAAKPDADAIEKHVAQIRSLQGSYGGQGHAEPALAAILGKSADIIHALLERERDAFNKGAHEGWMRCGAYHVDIDFEGRASEKDEVNRRWPIASRE